MRLVTGLFLLMTASTLLVGCVSSKSERILSEPLTESGAIQYQFAYEFYQSNELIRARRAIVMAKRSSPNNADISNLEGLILFRQGDYDQSEEAFREAVRLNPGYSEAYNNLGTLFYSQKKYREAEKWLLKALDNPLYLNPERIHNNLGLVYRDQGDHDRAKLEFERAMAVKPNYYLPYQNLAKLLEEKGNQAEAKTLYERAVELCAECAEPRYRLASLLLAEDLKDQAIRLFREAYELDPRGYFGQLGKKFLLDTGSLDE